MNSLARVARALRSSLLAAAMVALVAGGSAVPGPAAAQPLTSLEFSFSNPGARSLGFGGAFVALADDATAAFANPAGIVQIAKPELSIEGRSWSYSTPFTRGGRAAGEPTGWGIDTVAGPLRGESSAELAGLSYVAGVYPGKRWSLALFRHQLANFEFGLETQGLFAPGSVIAGTVRGEIQRGRVDLEVLSHGMAIAFRPTDPLSLGLSLSHFDTLMNFTGWDYLPDDDTVPAYFSAASHLPARLTQTVDLTAVEPTWGLSAGLLWRLSDRWNLGAVYRQGPSIPLEINLEAGPAHPVFPAGTRFVDGFRTTWDFPDVWALGLSYRSRDGRWTAATEWKRVEYSSIIESLLREQRDDEDFLNDADEIHLGGEYAFFAGTTVWAIRAGAWHDPDHYFGTRSSEPVIRAILVPGEDQLHFAFGLGIALRQLQIDLGMDFSDRIDTASLSVIYSFRG